MPKITEFSEDTAVGGAEKMYLVDGATDKYVVINSMKSVFNSSIDSLASLKAYDGLADNQVVFLIVE